MKTNQLIILISGIILVVLIFQLPKVLVADSKQLKEEPVVSSSPSSPEFDQSHSSSISETEAKKIEHYKNQLKFFPEKENNLIFADSIAELFRKSGLFDSAAVYIGFKADKASDVKNLEKAGDAYFDAFSSGDGKHKEFNDKARGYFQKVLDKQPENLEVKAKMAMTFVATENPMQGISILREILEKDPKNETALYNMGILSMQSGQYGKAEKRFEELLKINPSNPNARFYLGLAYLNSGKTKKAKEELTKAKQLESDPAFQSIVDSYLKDIKK